MTKIKLDKNLIIHIWMQRVAQNLRLKYMLIIARTSVVSSHNRNHNPNLIITGSSDLNEEDYRSFLPLPGAGGQIQLWQFLLELLDCPDKFKDIIVWEGDQHYFDD